MRRALAAALVLVTVAAAGCGGTSSTEEALNVAEASGGSNPSVARIERVRAPNGEPVDVVLVRADYCAAGGNGASIPSPGGGCGPNYASFTISPKTHKLAGVTTFPNNGAVEAVASARRSVPVLRTISPIPGLLARCKIPRSGSQSGTIAGLCQSEDLGTLENGDRRVEFLEHWPLDKPHGSRSTGGWIVILDRNDQVIAVHATGQTPPQLQR
jgi:hypothetical protein